MNASPPVLLGALAVLLAGVVMAELVTASAPPAPPAAPATQPARQASDDRSGAPRSEQVAALLARPPFSPDRRPARGDGQAADPGLPRLTGILIHGGDRRAIFGPAGPGRQPGRSAVVAEGEQIGAYRVQAIDASSVLLTGPSGPQTVTPRFSAAPPPASAAGLQPPQIVMPPQDAAQAASLGLAMLRAAPAAPPGTGNTQ